MTITPLMLVLAKIGDTLMVTLSCKTSTCVPGSMKIDIATANTKKLMSVY